MLTDAELAAHDPLARAFLREVRAVVPAGIVEEVAARSPARGEPRVLVARVPAVSPAVGDVLVHSDGAELTSFVGDHTHRHTGAYLFGRPSDPGAIARAAAAEAEWLRDLVEERVVIWSRRRRNGRVAAGGVARGGRRPAGGRAPRGVK